ncbi:hypothetical protein Nepgr_022590 [Nepenthes gracilis]|uniref:Fe2OG dioxygenase domain-containing protein n=1 Tax=Nepenthes gracilis TaxID=150966 RepID=A0AAD3SZ48_NEPGR|nr:hypothetical protein Nepgr_022590 [Nepenthes gracilis]
MRSRDPTVKMTSFPWRSDATSVSQVPANFVLPEDKRPNLSDVSCLSIPIIDMKEMIDDPDRNPSPLLVEAIARACEDYGFFQIVNHGVPEELCQRMLKTVTKFFELSTEEKNKFFSDDVNKEVRFFSRYLKVENDEKVSMWSEVLYHHWHPQEDFTPPLPKNPPEYREVIAEYAKEIGALVTRLLSLISQGLGLEKDCLKRRMGETPTRRLQANYYPPCPEPELTLGLAPHTDFNALTIVNQSDGVTGLQVNKDGKWVAVDPIPNSFVVNIGDQIQVLSNDKYKSNLHRAVTNKHRRVSLAMFYGPGKDTEIGPIENFIDEEHPRVYRNYRYAEFMEEYHRQVGLRKRLKEAFRFDN